MFRIWISLAASLVLGLGLLITRSQSTPVAAQMGPMMDQPLEPLSGDAFDQAFLKQMIMHHAMAVMMARPVIANAPHQELKNLGASIIADQTREIGQMRTWLKEWYGMEGPDPLGMMGSMQPEQMPMGQEGDMQPGQMPMGPEGHMMPGPGGMGESGAMPKPGGMTIGEMPMGQMGDMSMAGDLWRLPPQRLEVTFLSLMIPHHQGAIDMAGLVPDRAAHQELKDLASAIVRSQSVEIEQMNGWLASWYGL